MTRHVYLDVDGVLNAVTSNLNPAWGWGESKVVKVNGFRIRYSPTMVSRLNDLAEQVQFHWLTTWKHDAPRLLCREIGLLGEEWPVLDAPEVTGAPWWKLTAIRKHLAETKPDLAFWIDDDIPFDDVAPAWLQSEPNVVAIAPHTHVGLTTHGVEVIENEIKGRCDCGRIRMPVGATVVVRDGVDHRQDPGDCERFS